MLGLGAWLLVAPVRAGTFLRERYAIAPDPSSVARRSALRICGGGLVALGVYYAMRVVWPLLQLFFAR